jgi:hypothetical protein
LPGRRTGRKGPQSGPSDPSTIADFPINAERRNHIGITLDESTKRHPGRYHPVDGIEYAEMAEALPKPPRRTNFDRYYEEEWNCDLHAFLGINLPHRGKRKHEGQCQYRMYRTRDGRESAYDRDAVGE